MGTLGGMVQSGGGLFVYFLEFLDLLAFLVRWLLLDSGAVYDFILNDV